MPTSRRNVISLQDLEVRVAEAGRVLVACPTLKDAARLPDEEFQHLLLQRRFVSLAFSPFYDLVIDALDGGEARVVCREILREEYPDDGGNTPSHRELLVTDLVELGIDKHRLRVVRPTSSTARAILASFELVAAASEEPHPRVAVATTAACYAEALVAAEYEALRPRFERQMPIDKTVFYGPHISHDRGHMRRLLEEARFAMAAEPRCMATFDSVVERCLQVKLDFYQQFELP